MEGAFEDSTAAPTGLRGIAIAIFSLGNGGSGECIYLEINDGEES
jgi:hypothetical protein